MTVLVLFLLSLGLLAQAGVAQDDVERDLQVVPLYLEGTGLSFENPEGSAETMALGLSLMRNTVALGPWETDPVQKDMVIKGSVFLTMHFSGTGRFDWDYQLLVNGTEVLSLSFGWGILPGSPTSYGMGTDIEEVAVPKGSSIGIQVRVTYNGQGTVYWGSSDQPSALEIECDAISVGPLTVREDIGNQKMIIKTTVASAFGPGNIKEVYWTIVRPEGISNVTFDVKEGGPEEWAWTWHYGRDDIGPGDYVVEVVVEDRCGHLWKTTGELQVEGSQSRTFEYDTNLLIGAIALGLLIFLIIYKLFLGKYLKQTITSLRTGTKYFSDYKRLVAAEIFHDFSFNILLMYSAFILANSVNEEIGNFFVGLNFALYQTVAVVFALGITKRSDQRKRRRNSLLASIAIGGLILILASGVTIVPMFIALFVIYMVTFYTKEVLEVALVTEYFPSALRGKAYGILVAVANIGGIIGGAASGYLYEFYGMWLCLILSGTALLLSLTILWPIRDVGVGAPIPMAKWFSDVMANIGTFGSWLGSMLKNLSAKAIDGFLFEFRNRTVMQWIFISLVLVSIGSGMINPFVVVYLIGAGVSETMIGLVYTLIGLAIFMPVNQLATGLLVDRFSARKVFVGSIIVYILLWGIFNLAIAVKITHIAVLAIYSYPIWPFLYISSRLFAADVTPRSERARGVTLTRFAMGIGFVIASIAGGVMLFYGVPYEPVFLLAMVFIFMAVGAAFYTLKVSKGVLVQDE